MMLARDSCYILCCWYSYSDSNSDNNYLSIKINQEMSNPTDRSEPKRGHCRCLYQVKGRKMSQLFVKEKIFCQRGKGALREYTARSSSMSWHCRISDKKETQHFSYMSHKYILPFSCHRQLHFSKTLKKKKEHTVINFSKKGQNVIYLSKKTLSDIC